MRNNSNRKTQKPTARYNETVIDNEYDVRLLNTWEAVSLIVYLGNEERRAMWQTFRYQMPDIDVNLRHILMCVDTGRAMDQRFRRDRGFKIDFELKAVAGGISILMHVVTLDTDDGFPRFEMAARDAAGQFRMVDGKHVMMPATLTFERLFPENKLQKLYDVSEDLMAGMLLRRIRRNLRARGDRKSFGELQRSMENFLNASEAVPVERLTASVGDISGKKGQRPAKIVKPKDEVKPAKIGAAPAETAPAVHAKPTPDEVSDDLARTLTIAATGIDPGTRLPTDEQGNPPEPVASASPTPATKPKKEKAKKIREEKAPRASLADQLAAVRDQVPHGPSDGSNGQS